MLFEFFRCIGIALLILAGGGSVYAIGYFNDPRFKADIVVPIVLWTGAVGTALCMAAMFVR